MPDPPSRRSVLRDSFTLSAAVGVFGISFGVLATSAGLSVAKAAAMSLLVFTGASQFAAVGVIASGGSPAAALGSALLLAARNAAYGLAVSPLLPRRTGYRLAAAHVTLDESAAMATAQADRESGVQAFWATGVGVFVCWNLGTLIGAIAGSSIGDPASLGLDAAFPAGFVALLVPHLRGRRGWVAAVIGGLIALVLVPLTPAGTPIIAAALGVIPAVLWQGPGGGDAP